MTRRLLPYEHQLIKELGVSEDDYIDFLSVQKDYRLSEEDQLKELRAEPVSIILAVVGIVFQIVGALMAPKPSDQKNQRRTRDQRFSPRFGFNSSQDLAQYGDPVNLVYCNTNHNPRGAVRTSTSLVWSSVESYGSSQFMQLLLVLGASNIRRIDFQRVAFGQLPLAEFSAAKTWLYYQQNGRVRFNQKVIGDNRDPSRDGAAGTDDVCKIIDGGRRREGYSQAFSPSSMNSLGVYSPIPINVEVMERRQSGRPDWANLGIGIRGDSWQTGGNDKWRPGDRITINFARAGRRQEKVGPEAAKEIRTQLVSSLERGSIYMLGTARFKLLATSDNIDLDSGAVSATFECIEGGRRPFTAYGRTQAKNYNDSDRERLEEAEKILKASQEERTGRGSSRLESGSAYQNNLKRVDDRRDAEGENLQTGDVVINFAGTRYSFTGSEQIRWKNELDKNDSFSVPRGGSIRYTKKLLEQFLSNKPKLSTRALRDELEDDLEKARQLRDNIMGGDFDRQLRKEAKNNRAFQQIKREIERLKQDLENRIGRVYDLKKRSNNQGLLRNTTELSSSNRKIAELEKQIEQRRDERDDILSDDVGKKRKAFVRFIRDTSGPFRGLDGNRYAGGIRAIKRRLNTISGEKTSDQVGVNAVRSYFRTLIAEKEEALKFVKYVNKNWEDLQQSGDDHFFTKCLVKADSAAYQTVGTCSYVKFSLKCRLYRRIQGRQKKYGDKDAPDGYKLSDNGVKGRMAFFKVLYRNVSSSTFNAVPVIFTVRRSADLDNFIALNFQAGKADKWEFRLEPIGDIGAEIRDNGQRTFGFIENEGKRRRYQHSGNEFWWVGDLVSVDGNLKPALQERGPWYTNEWDLFSNRSDTQTQFSFDNGPEFTVTAVTEQQLGSLSDKYSGMSMMAFGVFSGRGVQDLRSITAYVLEGKNSWVVNDTTGAYSLSSGSTSYAPDIFADTVLDKSNGIGKYAKPSGIDWSSLALAKRFCKNNGLGCQLFMDGVIADPSSWRQFWVDAAPFSLLEFARIGGKEALIPAVPTASNGRATRSIPITALFNQGNILEGSYREEFLDYGTNVQDLIATVIYRETERQDVFPRNASVQVRLNGTSEDTAIRQTFDASQFVTQREQAILYGKLLCNQRRFIRRGVEFKTFPTDSVISPGAYVYVDIGLNSWDRITSGVVMAGGALNVPLSTPIANGSYNVLLYRPGGSVQTLSGVAVSGGVAAALANRVGHLFVLGSTQDRKRVFRVSEVQMDEEGEVTVKALEYPCDQSGNEQLSLVAQFSNARTGSHPGFAVR